MLEGLRQLPSSAGTATVLAARSRAMRQARACEGGGEAAQACLRTFLEERVCAQQKAAKFLRSVRAEQTKSAAMKTAAQTATEELKRQKLALAADEEKHRQEEASLDALKHFSAEMLGQGKENGGGRAEVLLRMELMDRVKSKFPALMPRHANNYKEFQKRLDLCLSRLIGHKGVGYGSWFAKNMKDLIDRRKAGHVTAFDEWMSAQSRANPVLFSGYVTA
jgi:hypothetical protein